jgi:CheY-like chemotaxis protein
MSGNRTISARILVVNDVEEIRDGTAKLLQATGYQVDAARSEEEAVSRALHQAPDLILVSLYDTQDQIVAMVHRVRNRSGLPERVPVVIFCVGTLPEGAAVQIGTSVYASRPDNFDDLRTLIARLLSQH